MQNYIKDFIKNRNYLVFGSGFILGFLFFYFVFLNSSERDRFEFSFSFLSGKKNCFGDMGGDRDPAAIQQNELELLPPPKIQLDKSRFTANQVGEIYVQWDRVKDAKKYILTVTDKEGKVIRSITTSKTSITFRDLAAKQGEEETPYLISIASLNARGFVGSPGDRETIIAHPFKDLTAPKIKQIVTED